MRVRVGQLPAPSELSCGLNRTRVPSNCRFKVVAGVVEPQHLEVRVPVSGVFHPGQGSGSGSGSGSGWEPVAGAGLTLLLCTLLNRCRGAESPLNEPALGLWGGL